jgi:hypothetical protein
LAEAAVQVRLQLATRCGKKPALPLNLRSIAQTKQYGGQTRWDKGVQFFQRFCLDVSIPLIFQTACRKNCNA